MMIGISEGIIIVVVAIYVLSLEDMKRLCAFILRCKRLYQSYRASLEPPLKELLTDIELEDMRRRSESLPHDHN